MLDSYRELMDELALTPTAVKEAAESAGEPPEGEWGAAQILAHMAAWEHYYFERLNALLQKGEQPLLKPIDEVMADYQEDLMSNTWQENLAIFNDSRGEIITLLMGMTITDWGRATEHMTRGEVTVEELIDDLVTHDAESVDRLRALA